MITGMYRDTIDGLYVEVREVWGSPDLYALSWLNVEGELCQALRPRRDVECDLRAGVLKRDYRRISDADLGQLASTQAWVEEQS